MKYFTSFKTLDQFLDQVELLANDDDMRSNWENIKLHEKLLAGFPDRLRSLDPFTNEYEFTVKQFYAHLQGSNYDVTNECLDIDVEYMTNVGYPYSTRSPSTVGNFLIAYGFIIRTMNLPAGSKILDIGAGAGCLTIHLAKMGYQLTCVDINPKFIELLQRMTSKLPNHIEFVCSEMNEIEFESKREYNAILFMEAFHHSSKHRETLKRVKKHLDSKGSIYFAAEPIVDKENDILPYAWGPRLDGESIRSIRKYGWIENGFTKKYFDEMLLRQGFTSYRARSQETHWADLIIASSPLLVDVGATFEFGFDGSGLKLLGEGWSQPESFGVWTCARRASLRFAWPNDIQSLKLVLTLRAFLVNSHSMQSVSIFIGDEKIEQWTFQNITKTKFKRSIILRREMFLNHPFAEIVFQLKPPISPYSLGLSEDRRHLGVALEKLSFV